TDDGLPRLFQSGNHERPSHHFWTSEPLESIEKTSSRLPAHDDVAGADVIGAPSACHAFHARFRCMIAAALIRIWGRSGSRYWPGQSVNHVSWWPMTVGTVTAVPGGKRAL